MGVNVAYGNTKGSLKMENKVIKSYKGFNEDMTCRGFKNEVGKEYEAKGKIAVRKNGFHACEFPLDCFDFYTPSRSVFHKVEQSGAMSRDIDDTRIASAKIKSASF